MLSRLELLKHLYLVESVDVRELPQWLSKILVCMCCRMTYVSSLREERDLLNMEADDMILP